MASTRNVVMSPSTTRISIPHPPVAEERTPTPLPKPLPPIGPGSGRDRVYIQDRSSPPDRGAPHAFRHRGYLGLAATTGEAAWTRPSSGSMTCFWSGYSLIRLSMTTCQAWFSGGGGSGDDDLAATAEGRPTAAADPSSIPVRPQQPAAYLAAVHVEGFRGVGEPATLPLRPGPGLTLITGRNGSGKSSFAEAAELVLIGDSGRWAGRTAVRREGWRNLHSTGSTAISVDLVTARTQGTTRIERRWEPHAPRWPEEPPSGPDGQPAGPRLPPSGPNTRPARARDTVRWTEHRRCVPETQPADRGRRSAGPRRGPHWTSRARPMISPELGADESFGSGAARRDRTRSQVGRGRRVPRQNALRLAALVIAGPDYGKEEAESHCESSSGQTIAASIDI